MLYENKACNNKKKQQKTDNLKNTIQTHEVNINHMYMYVEDMYK